MIMFIFPSVPSLNPKGSTAEQNGPESRAPVATGPVFISNISTIKSIKSIFF